MPTAKRTPATRLRNSAWEETSITTYRQPAVAIWASSPCSAKLSGVVRSVGITSWPIIFWMVPMRPTLAPVTCSSTVFSRRVTEVLPLVPVTPTMVMPWAG